MGITRDVTAVAAGAGKFALPTLTPPAFKPPAFKPPSAAWMTSPLVTRPPRPVPLSTPVSMFFSAASFCAAGIAGAPAAGALAVAGAATAGAAAAAGAAAPTSGLASVSMVAMISLLVTRPPSALTIFTSTPACGAGVSSTTLSVSISTRFSSRLTYSPVFLCHDTSVASATDSESWGTFTSTSMMTP